MDISSLGIQNFWIFVTSGILLNLTPGQDTIYIIGRSVAEGKRSGIASALGISTGGLIHVTAATLGLSALLTTSALAFTTIKLLGAAYLVYLGLHVLIKSEPVESFTINNSSRLGLLKSYQRGILTNVLNPKVALFFLAFLPQFVTADAEHRALSFLLLGITFICTGTVWCLVVALLSANVSGALRRTSKTSRILRCTQGVIFIGLGIKLALEHAK